MAPEDPRAGVFPFSGGEIIFHFLGAKSIGDRFTGQCLSLEKAMRYPTFRGGLS
jgi:hypothetical protein